MVCLPRGDAECTALLREGETMERAARLLLGAATASLAWTATALATAADGAATRQELVKVRESGHVIEAHWEKRPDSWLLMLALDPTKSGKRGYPPVTPRQQAAQAEASARAREQARERQAASPQQASTSRAGDRTSYFVASTVANLRGLDSWIQCGRELTLVDARRKPGQDGPVAKVPDPTTDYLNQPYPPRFKEGRVDAWLLKADGTQAIATVYSCAGEPIPLRSPERRVEISYEFPAAEGAEAWAVAIRIDDNYYIEKLEPQPAAR